MAIGKKLEEARNRKGISLREASESTKIRGDYLSSFESGQFDINLPEVYLRGFVRLYARFLDLDQDAILTDLELELGNESNRNMRKSLGSIAPQEVPDGSDVQNLQTVGAGRHGETGTFESIRKPLLVVGTLFALTVVILIAVALLGNGDTDEENLPIQADDPEVQNIEETVTKEDQGFDNGLRTLRLKAVGAIERLIVSDEGSDPKIYHEFKNVQSGWTNDLPFTKSFRCYSSSLENIRFAVDDGIEKQVAGNGSGNFSWSPTPNEIAE